MSTLLARLSDRIRADGGGPGDPMSQRTLDEAEQRLTLRREGAGTEWAWPEGVLPILDWGCGMYAAVDCRSEAGTVLLFEPNPGDPDAAWFVDSDSLAAWFEHYLADTGWWIAAEEGDDPGEMPLWTEKRS